MSVVILDFPAGRCPYDDCSYDGIQHTHAIPDAEVVAPAGVTLTQPQPDAGLREAAQAVADWEGWASRRPGEDVATIGLGDVDRLMEKLTTLRAALRSTPAAPEFGGSLASVQPTPAAPQPECSLLLADGTICVKRAGHSDDHGMALRSTPAAPHQHRFRHGASTCGPSVSRHVGPDEEGADRGQD